MTAQNEFQSIPPNLESPASKGFAVTPSDAAEQPYETRAIYVGSGGNLKVDLVSGNTITLVGVTTGSILPLRVKKIYATGTTASSLVGLY